MNIIKTILILFFSGILMKLFLTHTILGKTLLFILKDIFFIMKFSVRIIKYTIKFLYKLSKKSYVYLKKQYENYNKKENDNTESKKKVVNGNNIIDINKYTKGKRKSK
jgi:hypothetical protein